ncbi:hypothetical protein B0H13DRAFT_1959721 [Mycena leptocephala]|nr:hypothetical protein B0H13DRAFT_1959721 [Mycena leptocephala]
MIMASDVVEAVLTLVQALAGTFVQTFGSAESAGILVVAPIGVGNWDRAGWGVQTELHIHLGTVHPGPAGQRSTT